MSDPLITDDLPDRFLNAFGIGNMHAEDFRQAVRTYAVIDALDLELRHAQDVFDRQVRDIAKRRGMAQATCSHSWGDYENSACVICKADKPIHLRVATG